MNWSFEKLDALPEQQFSLWEKLLEKRTGIQLAQPQQALLQAQVTIRMRELGMSDHEKYYHYVQDSNLGAAEWQVLVDRLMVKETSFFRHRPSIELVRKFLQNKIEHQALISNFELWSVGCATGEEPYSLAAIVNDCFKEAALSPYFGITATDISLPALSIARCGIYGKRSLKLLNNSEYDRYFDPCDDGQYRVKDSIRQRVCFSQLNVFELKDKPIQQMDVIFCQNMLIYFRRWRRKQLLDQFVKRLRPGGLLVLGLGEVTDWTCEGIERLVSDGAQAYVKCS